jgi:hypothetical protein
LDVVVGGVGEDVMVVGDVVPYDNGIIMTTRIVIK